ncbi:MAG: c-type cytochrome [Verrucomicrobiae bacterium]|nr:c-type cytochrome [Verrucomicrobiae bacterium]
MDYGPYLTASIGIPGARTNIAYKGIAVNLGRAHGGTANEAVVFDTDLLRYAAGWTGNFVALRGLVYDGEHWTYPNLDGTPVFTNPAEPGWASNEEGWADPRPEPFGPLPRDWAHWKGLYRHGGTVVFSYTVGERTVLDRPSLEHGGAGTVFTRSLEVGAGARGLQVQVAGEPGGRISFRRVADVSGVTGEGPATGLLAILGRETGEGGDGGGLLAVGVRGGPGDAQWRTGGDGRLRLAIPSGAVSRWKLLIWRGPESGLQEFAAQVAGTASPEELGRYTRGGPGLWQQELVTAGRLGAEEGPYAIDELTVPEDNPWRSWMRFGALELFPDGDRAAVATWSGDVWIVGGIGGGLERLTWRRIATGLFQPLGLQIVDGRIFVLGRDQITLLHDLNGDGETDFYENFNNDALVSEHFHEFAVDLKRGADGDFYYVKCARHALPSLHAQHGSLIRVSRDGTRSEVVARGFRAVSGLGIGPGGDFTTIDNQGHWMPANRLNWVREGGWYGNSWAANPDGREGYDEPLCWMHNFVDRSGGTQLWVPTDRWGPLRDQLITLSYGMGQMFLVLHERGEDGRRQGAVTRFPVEFDTGIMRGVFHPWNRQLYTAGLYGWAGNKTRPGAFVRIRHTGQPLRMPDRLHIARDGIVLGFSDPLDPVSATDPGNYDLKAWNYRWSARYGSPDLRLDGQEGRDTWRISEVLLAADRRTVFLRVPQLQPVMQWHLEFEVRGEDGAPVRNFVHGTIHWKGSREGAEVIGPVAASRLAGAGIGADREKPGLRRTVRSSGGAGDAREDVQTVRLAALRVASGESPSGLVPPGPFRARWEGFLNLDLNDRMTFEVEGRGDVRLRIGGVLVLGGRVEVGEVLSGAPVALSGGRNPFELEYESPVTGDAVCRVYWRSERHPREPIPPTSFSHDAGLAEAGPWDVVREGRRLFGERHCGACHEPGAGWHAGAMPELGWKGPSFEGIGDRLHEAWMADWILDPQEQRADARMPAVLHGVGARDEARDLAAYLATLRSEGPDRGSTGREGRRGVGAEGEGVAQGARRFVDLGCVACHLAPGEAGSGPDDVRMSLGQVGAKWRPEALAEYLRQPDRHHAATRMPDFRLSEEEGAELAAWLLSGTGGQGLEGGHSRPGDPVRGRRLVAERQCLQCHEVPGGMRPGPGLALSDLAAADGSRGCLADNATDRGGAPRWRWAEEELSALRALGGWGWDAALRWDTPAEFAERQHAAMNCAACHGRDGIPDRLAGWIGGREEALDEDGSGAGSRVHRERPSLTFAGEKLRTDWVRRLLAGELGYATRPGSVVRMPAFRGISAGMAEGMARQHGYGDRLSDRAGPGEPDAALAEIGRRLIGVEGGFSCVSCHGVGERAALAGPDTETVNFSVVTDRLRREFYWRYVRDPSRLVPDTMMPRFIGDDGRTALEGILGGDAARQFEAIWEYLRVLGRER